jgi:hypothetical protein
MAPGSKKPSGGRDNFIDARRRLRKYSSRWMNVVPRSI